MNRAEPRRTIVLVNEHLTGGGAERQLIGLGESLAAKGDRVILCTWASAEVADAYPVSPAVERCYLRDREPPGRMGRAIATSVAWVRLVRLVRKARADVLISFSDVSNMLTTLASRVTGVPVIVSIRTEPEAQFALKPQWRWPALAAYRRADAVVVQTRAVAGWCQRHCRREGTVVGNMLRRDLPAAPPMSDRQPTVVSIGSLTPIKGHDVLIQAFARAHERHPQWRLVVLGEGPERAKLEELLKTLRVQDQVTLAGFSENVERVLADASIFVLASRFEGLPNALIEAMAMGTAAIATDCNHGPGEIIQPGSNGMLVPVDDVDALASALDRLMGDPALRKRLASEATRIRALYDPDEVFAAWDRVIEDAIAKKKAA